MNVLIRISYISNENEVLQSGSFPLQGKRSEEVAYNWWKQIRREMPYWPMLEKVIADGEDITELVRGLDEALL